MEDLNKEAKEGKKTERRKEGMKRKEGKEGYRSRKKGGIKVLEGGEKKEYRGKKREGIKGNGRKEERT